MLTWLDNDLWFPPQHLAQSDGLLAGGADLSPERLLLAYRNGIFPWFNEDEPPLWWCPDPHFVLFPKELKISKSMQQVLRRNTFDFRTNTGFEAVIDNCAAMERHGQDGTWITKEVKEAYITMHRLGYAHSAESWQDGNLVGGLYGMRLGNVFFGESMFAGVSNASKAAFIQYVQQLASEGVELIDCQVYTPHLESLGARMIPRTAFLELLKRYV